MLSSLIGLFRGGQDALESQMPQLQAEGILLQDANVKGSVTYRNFRSPQRIASYKKSGIRANIVLTKERLLTLAPINPIINVPLTDKRLRQMNISLEETDLLLVAFDANLFHSDWQGKLEYRFRTTNASAYFQKLSEITA